MHLTTNPLPVPHAPFDFVFLKVKNENLKALSMSGTWEVIISHRQILK